MRKTKLPQATLDKARVGTCDGLIPKPSSFQETEPKGAQLPHGAGVQTPEPRSEGGACQEGPGLEVSTRERQTAQGPGQHRWGPAAGAGTGRPGGMGSTTTGLLCGFEGAACGTLGRERCRLCHSPVILALRATCIPGWLERHPRGQRTGRDPSGGSVPRGGSRRRGWQAPEPSPRPHAIEGLFLNQYQSLR